MQMKMINPKPALVVTAILCGQYPTNTRLAAASGITGNAWIFGVRVVSKELDDLIVVD